MLNNASKSSSAIVGAGRTIAFGFKGVAASGVASIAPCLLSIIAFCFPSGTSSSSSATPFTALGAGTSERKSRSSDDSDRERLLVVDFGREKRFKNLETADCAGPSVGTVESTGLAVASTGVDVTGEAVLVDEAETEAVMTGGSSVNLLLDADRDLCSSAL